MCDYINLDLEKIVIDTPSSNNKFTHDEKIKYLEAAIRDGGYYGDDGTWNSIKVFSGDNHIYRVRVETLIIKDGNFIFLKFLPHQQAAHSNRSYLIPGGSIEKDISNIDQAINECREEARITVKNIQSSGVTYKEVTIPPKWAIATQAVNWNGNFTEVYVAEYDKPYVGHIDKVDMDKFMMTGKFYELDKVFQCLRKEHKDALKRIYPKRFNTKILPTDISENAKINKVQILDDTLNILTNAGFSPKVSKASRDAFINNKRHIVSDGSTICISGFKNKELPKAVRLLTEKLGSPEIKFSPDNYGTLFLSIGTDVVAESALSTKERNNLDDSQFGIPSLRKFPLHDKAHVIQAIRFFNTVDRKHEKELAHNLLKAMDRYEIDTAIIGERNRLITYVECDLI